MSNPQSYQVWYCKDLSFGYHKEIPNPLPPGEHVVVCKEIYVNSLDDLFELLNDAKDGFPNPLGHPIFQTIIRNNRLHTSMCVGDVAVDNITGEAWMCRSIGWEKVTLGCDQPS